MRQPIEMKNTAFTVDIKTGEKKPAEGKMMMLPAKEGTCEMCATAHEPEAPHNKQSLFYQMRFHNEHGRWPTWLDAMAHCSEPMKEAWKRGLREAGEKLGDEPEEPKVKEVKKTQRKVKTKKVVKHGTKNKTLPGNKKKTGRGIQQKSKTGRKP